MNERSNVTSIFLFEFKQSNRGNLQFVDLKDEMTKEQNNSDIDVQNNDIFDDD